MTLLALAQGEHLMYAASPGLWALALRHFGRYNSFTSFLQLNSTMLFTQGAALSALGNVTLLRSSLLLFSSCQEVWVSYRSVEPCSAFWSLTRVSISR